MGLDIDGHVNDLKSKINAYFNEHEELCTSARYIGLFPQLARQACQVPSTSTLPQLLHNIMNDTQSSTTNIYQYNQPFDNDQLTFNTHNMHVLSQPPIFPSAHHPLGPQDWSSGLVPPRYIAHNPAYYNVTNTYNQ